MLVCNVSLRPPRSAIAADLAEAAAALDDLGSGSGQVVFATLVDDPASVGEIVDAFLGEVMLEAASADVALDGILAGIVTAAVNETMTTTDTPDATVVGAATYATYDGTATNVTLSNGNRTATHNTTTASSGARSVATKSTGKFYFEVTCGATNGGSDNVGILQSSGTYANMNSGQNCVAWFANFSVGAVYSNNTNQGSMGFIAAGDIVSVAVDLAAGKGWVRKNGGAWIGSGDPATGTGGFVIAAGSYSPAISYGTGNIGDNFTGNFGQTAFTYTAPSGFGIWPAT